jgi:hypothetical protein
MVQHREETFNVLPSEDPQLQAQHCATITRKLNLVSISQSIPTCNSIKHHLHFMITY